MYRIKNSRNILFSFNSIYLVYLLFFFFGLNKVILYVPVLVAYFFVRFLQSYPLILKKDFIIMSVLYTFFLASTFIIGSDRMTMDSPFIILFIILFILLSGGFILQSYNYNTKVYLISFYLFGLFLDNFLIIAYSVMTDPILYGYGKLISPFTHQELNSPGVSNMLIISIGYFYYLLIYKKVNPKVKIISLFVVIMGIASGVFLAGRTFFVLLSFSIVFYVLSNFTIKKLFQFFILSIILSIIFTYFVEHNEYLSKYIEFLQYRFDNGLESNRFAHYANGLEMILQHPFNGFPVDRSIENTRWYHNIFLDTARVAGIFPILFFFFALVYTTKVFYYRNKEVDSISILWLIIVSFIIMQQDVVLEGQYRSIVILYFSSLILLESKQYK